MFTSAFLSSDFYTEHATLLCNSYQRYTGQPLIVQPPDNLPLIELLFSAPFALVSHGIEKDPIFNFGNLTALSLFEMSLEDFVQIPSRLSAEPMNQRERQRLLERVTQFGFIDDYSGIRISSQGRRFRIQKATVWNLMDPDESYRGQAAVFKDWDFLEPSRGKTSPDETVDE